jgi:hypothetical protein
MLKIVSLVAATYPDSTINSRTELTVPEFIQVAEGAGLLVLLHLEHEIELEILKPRSVIRGFAISFCPREVFFSKDVVQIDIGRRLCKGGLGAVVPRDGPAGRSRRNVGICAIGTEDTQHNEGQEDLHYILLPVADRGIEEGN